MLASALAIALAVSSASAQTFRRTGTCPTLGCIWPPDQAEFIAGQVFDIRTEVQAPVNGTEAYNGGVPNPDYTIEIFGVNEEGNGGNPEPITTFFKIAEPQEENYTFSYFEDLYAKKAKTPVVVNVLSKDYRHIALYNPGDYIVRLKYNSGAITEAHWTVLPLAEAKVAKNVILLVGDGMTQSMLTAARMLGHKSINGKYQSKLKLDEAPGFGMQSTHSIDSFITDSANSATALATGKKSTVNALNTYTDSNKNSFSDPKFETVYEMFRRIYHGQVGIVSTAFIADATPAAICSHTSSRSQYTGIIEQYLTGVSANYTWTQWDGVDVLFGGGAENFLPGPGNGNVSQIDRWMEAGYQFGHSNTDLQNFDNEKRALGLFSQSNMATWLDRNVYKDNLAQFKAYDGSKGTYDLPGLKEMTLKAVDILKTRSDKNGDTGFMLMSEAASIDKMMHVMDYDRALGDALELDNTVRALMDHLKELGIQDETLVVITADHGHGFDVYGSADTKFLAEAKTDREKRNAIGTYEQSGLSGYQVASGQNPGNNSIIYGAQGPNFPVQWDPRFTYAGGFGGSPDHFEDFAVNKNGTRLPAVEIDGDKGGYYANPADAPQGFLQNGSLPTDAAQGVHSLTDVPVFAWGPGHELFRGHQNSIDIAFHMALALDLGRTSNVTYY